MSAQREECEEPQKKRKIMVSSDSEKTDYFQIEEFVVAQNVSTSENVQVEETKSDNVQLELNAEINHDV